MNPVVWTVIGMMLALSIGASTLDANADEPPSGCDALALATSTKHIDSATGVRFMVKNRGLPMSVTVCVLDADGTKVAQAHKVLSNLETFAPRFELPVGGYVALTQASPPDGRGGVATSHRAELQFCPVGSWIAPSTTTRAGGGFGIIAEHGYCLPVDGMLPWIGQIVDGSTTDTLKSSGTALP